MAFISIYTHTHPPSRTHTHVCTHTHTHSHTLTHTHSHTHPPRLNHTHSYTHPHSHTLTHTHTNTHTRTHTNTHTTHRAACDTFREYQRLFELEEDSFEVATQTEAETDARFSVSQLVKDIACS